MTCGTPINIGLQQSTGNTCSSWVWVRASFPELEKDLGPNEGQYMSNAIDGNRVMKKRTKLIAAPSDWASTLIERASGNQI